MADNNGKTGKKSKAPLIAIIIAAVVLIAAGAFAILYFYGAFSQDNGGNDASVSTTSDEFGTTAAQGMHGQLQPDSESSEETNIVIPPTEKDGEITYFSGKFIPSGKVVDRLTNNNNATLREVFGEGYNAQGGITFNNDGTFLDALRPSHNNTGGYVVQNNKIIATYSDDINMDITVTEWNGNAPKSFYVVYADYEVYFG